MTFFPVHAQVVEVDRREIGDGPNGLLSAGLMKLGDDVGHGRVALSDEIEWR